METFEDMLKGLTALVGLIAFALAFAGALLAGVDPIFAMARAAACSVVLLCAFAVLTYFIPSLLEGTKKPDDTASH
ncbi:MAG TPA: hypothetical protein VGM37_20820 [Armatimonadota bacterium]|jgi:ABC-type iron transport system FetAB permease component